MCQWGISIHALREEGDLNIRQAFGMSFISIHALREEGDAKVRNVHALRFQFLSTPSARRATDAAAKRVCVGLYFYPRPPRGGRHAPFRLGCGLAAISIHALREEGDAGAPSTPGAAVDFYPRPPRGGRQLSISLPSYQFMISIHALREEGDPMMMGIRQAAQIFLSTPSARRATSAVLAAAISSAFLSTPSARRATRQLLKRTNLKSDFYPRPPRGGRLSGQVYSLARFSISVHALREEGDPGLFDTAFVPSLFLSTPSARRATNQQDHRARGLRDFYPRPPRGGRRYAGFFVLAGRLISIHALREEGDLTSSGRRYTPLNFYPRPPRGGRLAACSPPDGILRISIHALREEGDLAAMLRRRCSSLFLSTPSARRATGQALSFCPIINYFYPRPPRGGRPRWSGFSCRP